MERTIAVIAVAVWAGCSSSSEVGPDGANPDVVDAMPDMMAPSCTDGIPNQDETDIDCGGTICHACAAGRVCEVDRDCASGKCDPTTKKCSGLDVSFAAAVSYDTLLKPYVLLSGDVDGDGDIDLVVANEETSTIAIFRNSGTGGFTRKPVMTSDGFPTDQYPTGAAIADFNGDGIPDVATANFHGESVSILLGAGTGSAYTFGASANYPAAAGGETSNLAVGDLNGDGVPDVIATNQMGSSISVFLGRPNGTLGATTNLPVGVPNWGSPSMPYSVAIADFDGDGKADAAVADNASGRIIVLLGNGDGTFRPTEYPHINGAYQYNVIAHDMTLDGKPDLVVADRNGDEVCVLRNKGDGTFADGVCSPTGMNSGPYSVAVADFNLDGVPDVVTANFMTGNATVLLGIGNGKFDAAIDAGAMGQAPYGVAVGDFNKDGKPDFATANAAGNTVAVKLSTAH
jgi:FG-GAP-like repeat/FG-GAP repeat